MSRNSIIDEEIGRFLKGKDPEILCIKGKWGVGKTTKWNQTLDSFAKAGQFRKQRYSYVSLFGLSSLEELRNAIFDQTVSVKDSIIPPNEETYLELFQRRSRSWRKLVRNASNAFSTNTPLNSEAAIGATFLTVRDQLICIDDIERAGDGLRAQDVLGLALFLKEQRKCRVVLLLNDEQIKEDEKDGFALAIEKSQTSQCSLSPL
jgi:hypothetical protein